MSRELREESSALHALGLLAGEELARFRQECQVDPTLSEMSRVCVRSLPSWCIGRLPIPLPRPCGKGYCTASTPAAGPRAARNRIGWTTDPAVDPRRRERSRAPASA